jgi:hypothetical protein
MASTALLATVADAKASQLAGGVAPVMPAGVILPFGGATAPTGWLVCDGSQVSRSQYADLFAAIGTAHGAGDGSSTFHLPDFRGRFLRGADSGAERDPDRASRTAANSGGAVGDAVGSVQGNATKKNSLAVSGGTASHTGTTTFSSNGHGHYEGSIRAAIGAVDGNPGSLGYPASSRNPNGRGPTTTAGGYTVIGANYSTNSFGYNHYTQCYGYTEGNTGSASVGISSTAASLGNGDNETRPTNANVSYIIKV